MKSIFCGAGVDDLRVKTGKCENRTSLVIGDFYGSHSTAETTEPESPGKTNRNHKNEDE
jgi:hypothetical protein